jgi:hypothetical protein
VSLEELKKICSEVTRQGLERKRLIEAYYEWRLDLTEAEINFIAAACKYMPRLIEVAEAADELSGWFPAPGDGSPQESLEGALLDALDALAGRGGDSEYSAS